MRILQIISSGGMYGAEQMLLTLAHSLVRLGQECIVSAFDNTHRHHIEIAEKGRDLHLPVTLIPCDGRLDWEAVRYLRSIIREKQIDVLHAHGYKADVFGYLAAHGSTVATVSTCHNWVENGISLALYSALDRGVLRQFDTTVAVSEKVANTLRRSGVATERLKVIDNGIDVHRFSSLASIVRPELHQSSGPVVGFVGRLSPEKAVDNFILAAARIALQYPEVSFVVVGSGPERRTLQQLAGDIGIAHRVRFHGEASDMPSIYASLDILALPSLTEGLPLTLLEALAAKRAVVATAVGAIPEVVRHEYTGLLVAPGAVDELAAAIKRLLNDCALRRRLGEQGYRLVAERYSSETMATKYVLAYEQAVNKKHSRKR